MAARKSPVVYTSRFSNCPPSSASYSLSPSSTRGDHPLCAYSSSLSVSAPEFAEGEAEVEVEAELLLLTAVLPLPSDRAEFDPFDEPPSLSPPSSDSLAST